MFLVSNKPRRMPNFLIPYPFERSPALRRRRRRRGKNTTRA
jgi:hypothetical protein